MAGVSPTQNSLKHLRSRGYVAAVTERWNPYAKIRQDLFGILDLVAFKAERTGVMGVQTTSYSNMAKRERKVREWQHFDSWKAAGNQLEIHGWRKVKNKWTVRIVTL